jgi:hypothetical protein
MNQLIPFMLRKHAGITKAAALDFAFFEARVI